MPLESGQSELDALNDIIAKLVEPKPTEPLFHYTSLGVLMNLTKSRRIWASDIRFLSDAEESAHFLNIVSSVIEGQLQAATVESAILIQFGTWIKNLRSRGTMVFAASFTEQRNLLSQWRAYSPHGRGISIGFDPAALVRSVKEAQFNVCRCVYDADTQFRVATLVVRAAIHLAHRFGSTESMNQATTYYAAFEYMTSSVLTAAALMKNHAFHEELEWRAVSPVHSNYTDLDINFREGQTTLIPYLEVPLPTAPHGALLLERVVVGPSPHEALTINSTTKFLSNAGVKPAFVLASGIPYRSV